MATRPVVIVDVDGTLHGGAPDSRRIHRDGYREQAWGEDHAVVMRVRSEFSGLCPEELEVKFKQAGKGSRDAGMMALAGMTMEQFTAYRLNAYWPQEFLRYDSDLAEIFQRLTDRVRIVAYSDNPAARPTLNALGVEHLFGDMVFTPIDIGGFKSPSAYRKLFLRLAVAPTECWMFGDSPFSDIQCAVEAGIPTKRAIHVVGALSLIAALNQYFPE